MAVSVSGEHAFSKVNEPVVRLIAGLGVEGDAHSGFTVQHLSRVRRDPTQPNLRQVHLMHAELHDDLAAAGYDVPPGALGENVTTRGIDLLALPTGTVLRLGADAVVEVTGLRNPCAQIEAFSAGLLAEVVGRDPSGDVVRKAGVMGIVLASGVVAPGDGVQVTLPAVPHSPLQPV